MTKEYLGNKMYQFAKTIYPINRSVNAPGNLLTLKILKKKLKYLRIKSFKSGKKFMIGRSLMNGI